MMKTMIKKLFTAQGETLVETLIAIMIAALSATLLATAMLAASGINKKVEEADTVFQAELNIAENYDAPPVNGSVNLVFGSGTETADVAYYGGEGQLTSYRYTAEGGG